MVDISRHLEKAKAAAKKKNFPIAIGLYHQMLDLKPDDEEARRGLHEVLETYAQYRTGNALLSFLSTLGPRLAVFFGGLGKNHAGQARSWEKVLASSPGDRGALKALAQCLVRLSKLGLDLPGVAEVDLNPVMARPEGCLVVDARMALAR